MVKNRARQLWTKGALAASTVITAGAAVTGLASAQAVISTTGPDSFNSITTNGSFGNSHLPFFRFNFADQFSHKLHHNKFVVRHDSDNRIMHHDRDNDRREVAFEGSHDRDNDRDNDRDFSSNRNDNDFDRDNGGNGGGSLRENFSNNETTTVRNTNDVTVRNNNPQTATSGNVTVSRNTSVGDVSSGSAMNESEANFDVNVSNDTSAVVGGSGDNVSFPEASIDTTGPDSRNTINFSNRETTTVTNTNRVNVSNNNTQTARSGNVNVSRNTWVGDVSSGDASNTSSASFDINVSNN